MISFNIFKNLFTKISFKFKSIKNKIFFFSFLVSLSIILLIIFTAYFISYNTIKETSISRELNSLKLIANQTDLILNSAESSLTNIIVDTDVQKILVNCNTNNVLPEKKDILKLKRAIDNSMYKNSVVSGAILHTTNGFKLQSNSKFISLINLDNHMEFNKWYGAILDIQNKPYLYIAKKIFDMNTGKLIGYLEIFVKESLLSKNYTNNKFINFFLVNADGFITSSSNPNEVTNNIYQLMSNIEFADKNYPFKTIHNNSEDKLTLMLYYDKLNWNIVADIYLKDIIYNKQKLIFSLIILSMIGFICSYILSNIISRSITNPINNLYKAIEEVEKGNWSTEIKVTSSDEIGILSKKFNHLIFYIKNLLNKIRYEQNKKKEFELELIQLQIKPHFLYNSLENICALVELERNDDAVDMIFNLSTFYRGVLNKGNNIITIQEEIGLTESYLKIMKLRYYDIFDYKIIYDNNLNYYRCPKLLIQPLVENSIYHGLKNKNEKGNIIINIEHLNNYLKIVIKDTGIGMTKDKLEKVLKGTSNPSSKGGFAVKNTIERLNLFYPNDCTFDIESEKNVGTTIIIKIPLIRKESCYDKYTFN